jgi:tRNA 2-selenouridine synthase
MNGSTEDSQQFIDLFLNNTPFIDVRAEVEYNKGSFPGAFNEPILRDEERRLVGTCYKQKGQDKAIALGHQLVSGDTKQQRIDSWCEFAKTNPGAHVYCWRGGMRSNLAQQWMQEAGMDIPLITGGFKALRHSLSTQIETISLSSLLIVGGKTGTAKTPLINSLETGIDLEGLAHHRGSSFGRRVKGATCQIGFENQLAIDMIKSRDQFSAGPLFFEDESHMVGPVTLPLPLWHAMCEAPVAVVEMSLEFRVQHILQEYVVDMLAEHLEADKENGFENYREYLTASLGRIRKRLGLERYNKLNDIMKTAIDQQQSQGEVSGHSDWIECLLVEYYDPMYEYQLEKKQQRVEFIGDYQQVLEWAQSQVIRR